MRDPLHASTDLKDLPVYDSSDVPIGKTFGVLADAENGLVRFFDVDLDDHSRHVLIPVGHARVEMHMGRLRLRLRAATVDDLESIPAYEPHVAWNEDAFQNELLDAFGKLFQGQRYYAHPAYDHTGLYAGTHPLLIEPLTPTPPTGLRRLSSMHEFRVVEGEADIRGWPLHGEHDVRIGVVDDLIFDPEAQLVRYVVVKREVDDVDVIIPVGYVEVRENSAHTAMTPEELAALPAFSGDELDRAQEVEVRALLDRLLLLR